MLFSKLVLVKSFENEDWEKAGLSQDKAAQRELLREDNPAKDNLVRRGMHVIRI